MTRVLLAEDDTSISEPLSRALRREGYEVEVTADGPTTLDRALGEGVDLILLDIGLPELDGLEVCRRVRAAGYAVPAGRAAGPGPGPAAPGDGGRLGRARHPDRPGRPPGLARRRRA